MYATDTIAAGDQAIRTATRHRAIGLYERPYSLCTFSRIIYQCCTCTYLLHTTDRDHVEIARNRSGAFGLGEVDLWRPSFLLRQLLVYREIPNTSRSQSWHSIIYGFQSSRENGLAGISNGLRSDMKQPW